MKAYKGFNKDMTCRGFQFEEGETYHEENTKLCESGFHACLNPLDCFSYYAPSESVYHEVELDEVLNEKSEDSKICGKTIKIGAKLDVFGMVKIAVNYIKSNIDRDIVQTNTGNYSAATNTGYGSAATNTGNRSVATNTGYGSAATNTGYGSAATNTGYGSAATNTGDCSAATNTGNCSAATNTGDCSAATNTGDCSVATNTGDCSAATNTGDCSVATNTGNRSAATNTGNRSAATNTGYGSAATNTGYGSAATVEGKDSIAICCGFDCKARASLGSAICLCERGAWNGDTYPLKSVKAAIVDGKSLKPDTWYKLKNGEFVEAIEDEE